MDARMKNKLAGAWSLPKELTSSGKIAMLKNLKLLQHFTAFEIPT